jgi:hypothetical protein
VRQKEAAANIVVILVAVLSVVSDELNIHEITWLLKK